MKARCIDIEHAIRWTRLERYYLKHPVKILTIEERMSGISEPWAKERSELFNSWITYKRYKDTGINWLGTNSRVWDVYNPKDRF